ncbi:MAG: OsmC family protein [Bryobacterales bacterium]|nr:OsmC family protein [Bryobacterales bacterium]
MNIRRSAQAVWQGNLQQGSGTLSAPGGALTNTPYSFNTRFGDAPGTNPEELIAAAHAGCFTMATSFALQNAGFTATKLDTRAVLTMEKEAAGFTITAVHLTMQAEVPGIDAAQFQTIVTAAKTNCPVSKVLNCPITLEATLAG